MSMLLMPHQAFDLEHIQLLLGLLQRVFCRPPAPYHQNHPVNLRAHDQGI